jgi:hypothetical protein
VINAAQIFIWNYDPLDTYYDAQLGSTIDCAYWLEQTLSGNGHTVQTGEALPADISSYDVIYVTLGWYRC